MRRYTLVWLAGFLALGGLVLAGCGKGGSNGKKKPTFKPGKLQEYKNPKIGFSIQKPDNVTVTVQGDTAELKAAGFPTIQITLHKTKEVGIGSGSSGGMGKYTRKVYAPMRKLVCHCEDTGKHERLVKKICRSLKNTRDAPKKPSAKHKAPKITGKLKNGDAFKKALGDLEPKILACWTRAVAADAKLPAGDINVQITYKDDGSIKQTSFTRTFNHAGDKAVSDCVEKLVRTVKPEPDGGEVTLDWYLRFKLY